MQSVTPANAATGISLPNKEPAIAAERKAQMSDPRTSKLKSIQGQLGNQATVQREKLTGKLQQDMNARLREIGMLSNPVDGGKDTKYMGSMACHIYYNETLEQVFFVAQVKTLTGTNEVLCSMACQDLIGRAMEQFGRKAPTKRSGW